MYGPAKSVVESSRIYKQSSRIKANAKDQKNVTHSENIVCAVWKMNASHSSAAVIADCCCWLYFLSHSLFW